MLLNELIEASSETILGTILLITRNSAAHSKLSVASLMGITIPPIVLKQFRFYPDSYGSAPAFVQCAWLTKRAINELKVRPLHSLHISEWREGGNLVLVDFVAPTGFLHYLEKDVRDGS